MSDITIGSRVEFREDTPQHEANEGIIYVVEPSPSDSAFSVDAEGRRYVWLVDSRDADKAPSRRRRRTGYLTALRAL